MDAEDKWESRAQACAPKKSHTAFDTTRQLTDEFRETIDLRGESLVRLCRAQSGLASAWLSTCVPRRSIRRHCPAHGDEPRQCECCHSHNQQQQQQKTSLATQTVKTAQHASYEPSLRSFEQTVEMCVCVHVCNHAHGKSNANWQVGLRHEDSLTDDWKSNGPATDTTAAACPANHAEVLASPPPPLRCCRLRSIGS